MAGRLQADKLCNASARGDLSQVLLLLENRADVNGFNKFNRTALQVVKLGSTAVVEALLAAGANPNVRDPVLGLTVTHDAAREGFADTVGALLSGGADANLANELGNLPLHLAAREGHLGAARLLAGRTADPGARNAQGHTAAELARLRGKTDVAEYIDSYVSAQTRQEGQKED